MTTISVAINTFYGEKHHLVNLLRSLVLMEPDEVCIADTSRADDATVIEFYNWLHERAEEYRLPIKVTHKPFDGWYSHARNRALAMCSSDWTALIDSDEMMSLQAAHDLRNYLGTLPQHILAVRLRRIMLLDDTRRCPFRNLWPPWLRRSQGSHPRIYRTGVGHYEGRVHERYIYPGRKTIPFHSPEHPKMDWNGGYKHCFLHLWMYKDNIMRRKWGGTIDVSKMPLNITPDEAWRAAQKLWREGKGCVLEPVPDEMTWVPIVWKIDPDRWALTQTGDRWGYKLYYGQGGR